MYTSTILYTIYLSIQHNLYFLQRAKLAKFLVKFPLCGIQAETKNTKASSLLWIFSAPNMPSSSRHWRSTVGSFSTWPRSSFRGI